jgi:hypothetical protein
MKIDVCDSKLVERIVEFLLLVCDLNLLLLAKTRFDRDLTGDRAVGLQVLI